MAGNKSLNAAAAAKQDEFYTQITDIEKELRHYRKHFAGKTILCNCDDPFESNFFKYFVLNFNRLGLAKLIATCYAGSPIVYTQMNLFGEPEEVVQAEREKKPYKVEVTQVYDTTGDGGVDMLDVEELFRTGKNSLELLEGDGDFRSPECLALLDEADIVVTNPPFSLFREYVATLMEYNKKFIIIGSKNGITYKEIFPHFMNNEIWLGYGFDRGNAYFSIPKESAREYASGVYDASTGLVKFRNCAWFTNLDIRKRHEELILVKRYNSKDFPRYDNYDAIEVSKTADIPCDYAGVMGVPITYLDKYNPEQFQILGITKTWFGAATKTYPKQTQIDPSGKQSTVSKLNDGVTIKIDTPPTGKTYYMVGDEMYQQLYPRILIRNLHPEEAK